jgi:uncharacterized repeat protein (TIGR01451 family)
MADEGDFGSPAPQPNSWAMRWKVYRQAVTGDRDDNDMPAAARNNSVLAGRGNDSYAPVDRALSSFGPAEPRHSIARPIEDRPLHSDGSSSSSRRPANGNNFGASADSPPLSDEPLPMLRNELKKPALAHGGNIVTSTPAHAEPWKRAEPAKISAEPSRSFPEPSNAAATTAPVANAENATIPLIPAPQWKSPAAHADEGADAQRLSILHRENALQNKVMSLRAGDRLGEANSSSTAQGGASSRRAPSSLERPAAPTNVDIRISDLPRRQIESENRAPVVAKEPTPGTGEMARRVAPSEQIIVNPYASEHHAAESIAGDPMPAAPVVEMPIVARPHHHPIAANTPASVAPAAAPQMAMERPLAPAADRSNIPTAPLAPLASRAPAKEADATANSHFELQPAAPEGRLPVPPWVAAGASMTSRRSPAAEIDLPKPDVSAVHEADRPKGQFAASALDRPAPVEIAAPKHEFIAPPAAAAAPKQEHFAAEEVAAAPVASERLRVAVRPTATPTAASPQRAKLELALAGPHEIGFGQSMVYRLALSNRSDIDAEEVSVRVLPLDSKDTGASHRFGHVAAGETKVVELELVARQLGTLAIRAEAAGAGGLHAEAQQDVVVAHDAALQIAVHAPATAQAGSVAVFTIGVRNVSKKTIDGVQVGALLPPGAKLVGASQVVTLGATDAKLQFAPLSLAAGAEQRYELKCMITGGGAQRLVAEVLGANQPRLVGEASWQVESLADLNLEVREPIGPLVVGQETVYEIHLENRGSKTAEKVEVRGLFSRGIEPTAAQGAEYQIADGAVNFQVLNRLEPGKSVVLKIKATADQPGSHVFRAEAVCANADQHLMVERTKSFSEDAAIERTAHRPVTGTIQR